MRTTKKLLSLLLALCMVVSLLPATALAASVAECPGGDSCDHEAAIGETHYDTLKNAMGSVQTGQTITLLKDVTLQKGVKTEKKPLELPLTSTDIVSMAQRLRAPMVSFV